MRDLPLTNAQLAELQARMAEDEPAAHRQKALQRAARSAYQWPEEASSLLDEGRSLTELRAVGPWLARVIETLSNDPAVEPPPPPELRRDFLTLAEVRRTLAANPDRLPALRGDLQSHTTYSDGKASLREMAGAAAALGYEYQAVTDHSKGLPIARGMHEARLGEQGEDVAIEMNLSPDGEGDMEPEALARLDLVLGAFHSQLRVTEDQTERYLKALRNPTVNVLAHPRGRRFNVRLGLGADWARVFEEAARLDRAVEIDAHLDRQDLNVELLRLAREAGTRISIGTDAHSVRELGFMEFGVAAAIRAGIAPERILNCMAADELLAWARETRGL